MLFPFPIFCCRLKFWLRCTGTLAAKMIRAQFYYKTLTFISTILNNVKSGIQSHYYSTCLKNVIFFEELALQLYPLLKFYPFNHCLTSTRD